MEYIFTPTGFCLDGQSSEYPIDQFYSFCFKKKEKDASLTEQFLFSIAEYFIDRLLSCSGDELNTDSLKLEADKSELEELASTVPFAIGSNYVDGKWVKKQLDKLLKFYKEDIKEFKGSIDLYFNSKNESLTLPSRLYFHLVQAKGEYPFAFMVTYTTVDEDGVVHHYPLRYALTEYKDNLDAFSALISPLSTLSKTNEIIRSLVESGKIFYPIRFTVDEAYELLSYSDDLKAQGIECRVPNFWKKKGKYTSLSVSVKGSVKMNAETLLTVRPALIYEGVTITSDEIKALLSQKEGLVLLKGKWVVLDKAKLEALLYTDSQFKDEMDIKDLVAYSSGLKKSKVKIVFPNKNWLEDVVTSISQNLALPRTVKAELRPYQAEGFRYLSAMSLLGFGMCLADDMGLGKTVQVLSYLEAMRVDGKFKHVLLVIPASLIGNWMSEIEKFTPALPYHVYHGQDRKLEETYLTITTYGVVTKDSLLEQKWDEIILDEAQYIKNSGTKAYKNLNNMERRGAVLLTGTPVENNLMNLWSLMSFSNAGILGSKSEFKKFSDEITPEDMFRLKKAINPFILRRMKTDKSIISDLPDKIENDITVALSKEQIILYEKVVKELEEQIELGDETQARGMVLSTIMRLKQICNHPDQYTGESKYKESESGKFEVLKELASTIHANREKVLVFTQFKEIIPALYKTLEEVFASPGLTIDGTVSAKKRTEIVKEFQEGNAPYMVLSLRAAGVGLNLTKASNVIHFDRWWNPAVENQATDRAFRIGQKNKVMVYKFITKDTIEEKIDALIKDKQSLADSLLGDMSSDILSKLSPRELLDAMKFTGGRK